MPTDGRAAADAAGGDAGSGGPGTGAAGGGLTDGRLLTVAEVAEALRVSRMTVYRLVHSGELPAVRVGRSYRVPEGAASAFLAAARTAPPAAAEQRRADGA
ncbi:helix-turn-helix domain-containing protein [Pseudokineococcus sp. 5B2Z-1]|uniref:helix-turn-helix domain-containing protein n=1 Tax=Pseudokineococcus sp. 5B2Z-1 TaxID=3132744 RepID=UPI0030B222FF